LVSDLLEMIGMMVKVSPHHLIISAEISDTELVPCSSTMAIWHLPDCISVTRWDSWPVAVVDVDFIPMVLPADRTVGDLKQLYGMQRICASQFELPDGAKLEEFFELNPSFSASAGWCATIDLNEIHVQLSACLWSEARDQLAKRYNLTVNDFLIDGQELNSVLKAGVTYTVSETSIKYSVVAFGYCHTITISIFATVGQLLPIVEKLFGVSPLVLSFRGLLLDLEKPLSLYKIPSDRCIVASFHFELTNNTPQDFDIHGDGEEIFIFEFQDRGTIRWRFDWTTRFEEIENALCSVVKRAPDSHFSFQIQDMQIPMGWRLEEVRAGFSGARRIHVIWMYTPESETS
jgi:hypothetical protein